MKPSLGNVRITSQNTATRRRSAKKRWRREGQESGSMNEGGYMQRGPVQPADVGCSFRNPGGKYLPGRKRSQKRYRQWDSDAKKTRSLMLQRERNRGQGVMLTG